MRRIALPLLALVATLAVPARAEEEATAPIRPFLWVVEGEPKIYLYGTIHVPDDRVMNLPAVVEQALAESDVFWAEIAMEPDAMMQAQMRAMFPPEESLSQALPAEVYERAGAFLQKRGMDIRMFERIKVWALATTLPILDILPQLATKKPLDRSLYDEMKAKEKEVGGLETVDEQIDLFDTLTPEQQTAMLVSSLDQLDKWAEEAEGKSLTESLIEIYLAGDPQKLLDVMYAEYDPTDELQKMVMKRLLDDRNLRMVDRILERTAKAPEKTYFVAVGAAHYPGEKGILKLLEAEGRVPQRVEPAPVTLEEDG